MKRNAISLAVLSAIGSPVVLAEQAVDLGNIEIIEKYNAYKQKVSSDTIYESYDPIDSGLSVMSETSIQNNKQGGIDTTQLLKSSPFVQMDNSLDDATKENIQSLRPQNFSISGGNYYDNNIQIDGVSATSAHSVTGASGDLDWNNVSGQTSQTLYVSPDLLDAVNVYDSNVSAEFGDFTGGVVNYEIRKPKDEFGFSLSSGFQNDSLVKYHDPTEIDPDELPEEPADFYKYQTTVSFDLPINEKLSLLTSYSRSESSVKYKADSEYGGNSYDNGDLSENYLLKARYKYNDDFDFEAQLIHSPYESQRDLPNARNDLTTSHSAGTQGYLSANGIYKNTNIRSKLSVNHSDASRKSANERYVLDGDYLDWCDSTKNCNDGGIGDLEQTQTDYTWNNSFSTELAKGTLNYGAEIKYTDAKKARPDEVSYFFSTKPAETDTFICQPGDKSCQAEQAASKYNSYGAYNADVGVYSHALWSEYLTQINAFEIRTGLRYSYDNFLNNHTFAPRLTASWEFRDLSYLTFGANRYYASKMIGYAIKEQESALTCFEREYENASDGSNGGAVGDWTACSRQSAVVRYSNSDLKTPYSDELTAAITLPTYLDGNIRFKTVFRQNRDQFARSDELTNTNGEDYYIMTNDGETDYMGYSLEWSGSYNQHFFNANLTWSETKNNGLIDYDANPEDEAEFIYFNGQIMTLADMYEHDARQNYAAPWRASASWSTMWFNDRLMTNATVYFRGETKSLVDTYKNHTAADGTKYDIYDFEKRRGLTTVDLNATYHFLRTERHHASVDIRIKNLFDEVYGSEQNYQIGRSFWLGVNYSM